MFQAVSCAYFQERFQQNPEPARMVPHQGRSNRVLNRMARSAEKDRVARLVRSAQAGDDRAFAELVRSHQDIAVAYATSILRDYQLGEDAAQGAFVDAYRALPSLRA